MREFTITASVEVVLKALRENRAMHAKEYDKAKRGWKKLLRKEFQAKIDILDAGGELRLAIENQKPESHVEEYDEAIEMLEYCQAAEIVLDAQLWRQFVKDDWSWKRHWSASNSTYIASA